MAKSRAAREAEAEGQIARLAAAAAMFYLCTFQRGAVALWLGHLSHAVLGHTR